MIKTIFKKPTEIDKIKEEIENKKFNKNTLIVAVESEQRNLELQKEKIFQEIGLHTYQQYIAGNEIYSLEAYFSQIKILVKDIAQKNLQKDEIGARYDEEINLLISRVEMLQKETSSCNSNQTQPISEPKTSSNATQTSQTVQEKQMQKPICAKCHHVLVENALFCQVCGKKI